MGSMTGLLILTQPVRKILPSLPKVLKAASQHVTKTLYVHLDPLAKTKVPETKQRLALYSRIITDIYSSSPLNCQGLDVRVLMAGFKDYSDVPLKTQVRVDLLLFDRARTGLELAEIEKRYKSFLMGSRDKVFILDQECENQNEIELPQDQINEDSNKMYSSVVIGGTYDCIHAGHKILLTEALLRCKDRLTCGVADGPLLKNKILSDLIEPCEKRISNVKELAMDIDPTVEYNIVQITDPMGPTKWDPNMDMIVVSEETKKGIALINKAREEGGLKPLDGYVITLVNDECRVSEEEEVKLSASSQRMRLLGTIRKPVVPNPNIANHPYVIGLTGGSASGKSSISNRFAKLGAGIVDCDKLGHKAYKKNTQCYTKLIETFGSDLVSSDDEINRKALGAKVFNDKEALEKLNNIVWPEIASLAMKQINDLATEGYSVVILDAAVLLEAGWEKICHQVWVCIITQEEAVTRIVERDGKSQKEAQRRINSQLSNRDRVARANIVFCTQWDGEYTQQQVEKAWATLRNYTEEEKNDRKAQL
ncbi:bifunctional coenzyme A synthase-like [Homarus americanus]|nr:bifunctional coenzyme A synthase-like [Homarus americanus]XP_042210073.1 bifunctional coenzyme A synthase-like [Homarus americanus]XP_042210074.1 bifunctional coenzyme A synthase-like [Homarus americanus]XP_042210075.1 bifunctional coenzyme A synthase-like [Homarus americanus]